ncbi:MAG TPA: SBBP repeat-containing protein [Bryobacteraceae bacterium]|nr:SBBP repeat-containing protein [Bryobacteraceae bacterium]
MRAVMSLLILAVAPGFAENGGRSLPLFFVQNPNLNQADSTVRFVAETRGMRAGFRGDSVEFLAHGVRTQVRFVGANPHVEIEGAQVLSGKANFLIGERRAADLEIYGQIVYRRLYDRIDMAYGSVYSGEGQRVKSEFRVAPGGDPGQIRLEYAGVERLFVDGSGNLVAVSAGGELREDAPEIYQDSEAGRIRVSGRYRLIDGYTAGFEIGEYDSSKPLIIDPTISYSTYLGGSSMGDVTGVAVDSSGNLYVTGWTEAINFPIAGAFQAANDGDVDAFIVKLNPAGSAIVYATYLGGLGDDRAAAIAVDAAGNAYITGSTGSSNFPLVAPAQATFGGGRDAFAAKLNAAGNALVYSTYLGGTNTDLGTAIAIDGSGNAYVAGDTLSANFPVAGGAQNTFGGQTDSFVVKLNSSGARVFSTFLGGAGAEHAGGIAVDASLNVYIAGGTSSSNFPVVTPIQAANAGSQNAFITKLNPAGSAILYSTYLGGTGGSAGAPEQANGIAVDGSGSAYVAGITNSANFPVTSGAFQTTYGGASDGFVAKINAAGNALAYSTYLGGSGFDQANGIAVDATGNASVAGYTSSVNFVSVNGTQAAFGGLYDAFVSKLNPAGSGLSFSTYYGGSGSDSANAIALDSSGNIFVGGQTNSTNLPLQTPIQSSNSGGSIGWVARLGVTAPPAEVPSVISVTPASGSGNTVTFTAQYADSLGPAKLTSVALLVNGSASTSFGCYVSYSPASGTFALASDDATTSTTVIPGGGSAANDQCTLVGTGSSVAVSASNLTLTIALAFGTGFPGNKSVYLYAQDSVANTGWIALGAWTVTVPAPQPSAVSVSPNANSGSTQTFQFVFTDTQNPSNIIAAAMLFAPSLASFTNTCYVVYDAVRATVQLEYDNMTGASSKPVTSSATLQNSQCSVGATSAVISGLSIIVTLTISFSGTFSGVQNIFMYASEGNGTPNTGWVQNGTFLVTAGGVPTADSVVPASGAGPAQRFSFQVSDQGGAGFITDLAVLFNTTSTSTTNACFILYDGVAQTLSLYWDNPSLGVSTLKLGATGIISNDQCSVNAGNSTVVVGTTAVVLTVDIAFNASFGGTKNVYVYGAELNANTGWVQRGTWNVTGGAPTADSVTPSSGAGSNLINFTFSASDTSTAANIANIGMLFTTGSPANIANACYLVYNALANTIGLYDNTGTVLGSKPLGSSANLTNSQCAVGGASLIISGKSVLFTVQILFLTPGFNGAKTVYEQANELSASSGWVSRGTWTVQ